jgi:hypothetical protein
MLKCKHPDRDNSKIVCGYPIPCPYHTAIIDLNAQPVPTITIPVTADAAMRQSARARLAQVGIALKGSDHRKRRGRKSPA